MRRKQIFAALATLCFSLVSISSIQAQLDFAVDYSAGTSGVSGLMTATTAATDSYKSVFKDDTTVSFTIEFDSETSDFTTLPSSVLGAMVSKFEAFSYTDVKSALGGDALSADDIDSLSLLQDGTFIEAMTNVPGTTAPVRIGSSMGAAGEGTWNSMLKLSRANAKALGFATPPDGMSDFRIIINDDFIPLFDFDRSDGVEAGKFDFQTIVAHEIAHGMGFLSGVDDVDFQSPTGGGTGEDLSDDLIFSVLDLFRTNVDTRGMTGLPGDGGGFVLDWRYGPPPGPVSLPFLSLDSSLVDPGDKIPFSTRARDDHPCMYRTKKTRCVVETRCVDE